MTNFLMFPSSATASPAHPLRRFGFKVSLALASLVCAGAAPAQTYIVGGGEMDEWYQSQLLQQEDDIYTIPGQSLDTGGCLTASEALTSRYLNWTCEQVRNNPQAVETATNAYSAYYRGQQGAVEAWTAPSPRNICYYENDPSYTWYC